MCVLSWERRTQRPLHNATDTRKLAGSFFAADFCPSEAHLKKSFKEPLENCLSLLHVRTHSGCQMISDQPRKV